MPLLARIYPNGPADVNQFHAAGGMGFLIRELLDAGCCIDDVAPWRASGSRPLTPEPWLDGRRSPGATVPTRALETVVLRPVDRPVRARRRPALCSTGNLGRAVIKVSAVKPEQQVDRGAGACLPRLRTSCWTPSSAGELERDFVAVVRFQGPRANGMPELHKLTPALGVLQDRGFKVALVTDGRMSGASGKVPAAIHVTPEAADGGPIGLVATATSSASTPSAGRLEALVDARPSGRRASRCSATSARYHAGARARAVRGLPRSGGAGRSRCLSLWSEAAGRRHQTEAC